MNLVMEYVQQLEQERDLLAAQNEAFREVLEFYMAHGITEPLYYKARDVLNLPNLASEVLKRRDAEVREECAKVCDKYAMESSNPMNFAENCAAAIRARKETT